MDRTLYQIVLKGDTITFLKLVEKNETLITQTVHESSNTILHLAARFGHLELVTEILKRWPDMVEADNADLETALHEACREGEVEVMKALMEADEGVVGKVNCRGESVLFVACERGKVEVVKHLIVFQWLLLHEVDAFVGSVHVAAAAGHTEILKEILKVRPEFARKYTSEGYAPLHLACNGGHIDTIRELLSFEPDLLHLRDHKGWTPLHWASMKGRVENLGEILSISTESVEMVTNHGETIFHLAVKYNQFDSLRYLMERLNILELMNKPDNDGNTILHLATAGKLTGMVLYLLQCGVDVNAINQKGHTALDVVQYDGSNSTTLQVVPALLAVGAKRCDQLPPRDIQEVLVPHINGSTYSKRIRKPDSPISHTTRKIEFQMQGRQNSWNNLMVVAVLIATITFSAGINPPGGIKQETGKVVMGGEPPFKVFIVCNTMALFLSLGIVFLLVIAFAFESRAMMQLLVVTYKTMWLCTIFIAMAYIAATWTILPQESGSRLLVIALTVFGAGFTVVVVLSVIRLPLKYQREIRRRLAEKNREKDEGRYA